MMKLAPIAALLLVAACKKPVPQMEEKKDAAAAPAEAAPAAQQQHVEANVMHGAELIKKAQNAADTANKDVKRAEGANQDPQ